MVASGADPPYRSILGRSKLSAAEDPECFADLNLDQLVESVTASRSEYPIAGYFRVPLHDPEVIRFRQEVFQDLEDPTTRQVVDRFCEGMRQMRGCVKQSQNQHYPRPKQRWWLEAASTYCQAVDSLGEGLEGCAPISEGLRAWREYLRTYRASETFGFLRDQTAARVAELSDITFSVRLHGARVSVRRYEAAPDYSAEILTLFDRFRQRQPEHRPRTKDPFALEVNHVEAAIIDMAARFFPDQFAALADYCQRRDHFVDQALAEFDTDVQFYLAYLDFVAGLRSEGLGFCYPDMAASVDQVYASDAFDPVLADRLRQKKARAVVTNTFNLADPERILVVSGPNQGGKTTFARMVGQLHYLAALGCPVPGGEARLLLFDRLFTHFEREESLSNLAGKLEDDLLRAQAILTTATSSSLIVINEIFTSTTVDDASFLTREVLDKIIDLGSLCVMVTFIDELATISPETVSMVSAVDPNRPTERTYRIARQPPTGLAYAAAIADKYHLSYQALRERVAG